MRAFPYDRAVELSWNTPSDATEVARWQYRYKSGSDYPDTWTNIANSSRTTTSVRVGGLTNGTAYTFQVRAVASPWTKDKLTAIGGNGEVNLSWEPPDDTTGIAKWQFRYRRANYNFPSNWTEIPSSSATTKTHTADNLTNGTTYFFQVRAVNSSNVLVGEVLGYTTATPFAATSPFGDVAVTPPGWTAISGSGATTITHTVPNLTNDTL